MSYKAVNQRARSHTCTLTGTSDSSIFIVATVVAGDVCTVCKVGFSSITLDIIHEDCSTPLSKVSPPQGSSYVTVQEKPQAHPYLYHIPAVYRQHQHQCCPRGHHRRYPRLLHCIPQHVLHNYNILQQDELFQ